MAPRSDTLWNYEKVVAEASKYESRSDFQKGSGGAFSWAWRNGVLDDLHPPMQTVWDLDKVLEAAMQCKTRSEFGKRYAGAYFWAKRNNVYEDVVSHMVDGWEVPDTVYAWKVSGYPNVFKFGVGRSNHIQKRVTSVSTSAGLSVDFVLYKQVDNPRAVEAKLLGKGQIFDIGMCEGFTEFRILTGSDLLECLAMFDVSIMDEEAML